MRRIIREWTGEFVTVTVWTRTGATVFVDVCQGGRVTRRHRFHDTRPHVATDRAERDGASEFRINERFYRDTAGAERLTLTERVERAVRDWPEWSRAERRRIGDIVAEVLDRCRPGLLSVMFSSVGS